MIDRIEPHLLTVKALSLYGYGAFYLMMALWIISRGLREPGTFSRWRSDSGVMVPGRVILGIFLLFATFREWDIAYNRLVHKDNAVGLSAAVTDWNSVVPVAVGVLFGLWATIRFIRNDVGEQKKGEPVVTAIERTADAMERQADATEALVEQGANGKET